MRQFLAKIVKNTNEVEERMPYLEQFTGSEANIIVNGYTNVEANKGYTAAVKTLKARYGGKCLCKKKIWTDPLSNPTSPRELTISDRVRTCYKEHISR